jgi:hypothetical protein
VSLFIWTVLFYNLPKNFETSILPINRVEVNVNTNYTMKTYDVYNGSGLLDTGSAWTPKGLLIVKYEYKI